MAEGILSSRKPGSYVWILIEWIPGSEYCAFNCYIPLHPLCCNGFEVVEYSLLKFDYKNSIYQQE